MGHYGSTQEVSSNDFPMKKKNQFLYSIHFSRYITDKLIQYCEKLSNPTISSERKPLENARFVVPFEKDGNHFQFDKTAETFILSKKPIAAIDGAPTFESDEVPDLSPLSSNIGIDKENIYKIENVYREYLSKCF